MEEAKGLGPITNEETSPTSAPAAAPAAEAGLKRVDSKYLKAETEHTGYIHGDYKGVKGRVLDVWRNNFVSRLARVVGLRFVRSKHTHTYIHT